ncbi:diacylglycerol kinase [Celeribacter litoreus]|uniref:diacylglycerol kinase n=1 Tax=Celeribacter litoreus TaxID=2876714 RepID=UPI001CCF8835|nr:diacylglycerol kinase [Celeribacter litoreus]MCA0042813.1 diacylglycerol kinase [Celeribacter litoreus]
MVNKIGFALKHLVWRTLWSIAGLRYAWTSEDSFRSWVYANLVSAIAAFVIDMTTGERALILALGILVLAAELFNTAIEDAVDHISEEIHPLAKSAKDAGSAAVTMTAIAAGVAWVVVLIG